MACADGAAFDAEGCLWFAEVFGGRTHRVSPEGEILMPIEFPVLKAISFCPSGAHYDPLYVTAMSKPPLPKYLEDRPISGSLFAISGLGFKGLPELRFAGQERSGRRTSP